MEANIFDNIVKKAKAIGMSINLLEQKAGLSSGNIYKWKKSSPSVAAATKVAKVLNCTVDELTNGEPEKE